MQLPKGLMAYRLSTTVLNNNYPFLLSSPAFCLGLLTLLHSSCKWKHLLLFLLSLVCFIYHSVFLVYTYCSICHNTIPYFLHLFVYVYECFDVHVVVRGQHAGTSSLLSPFEFLGIWAVLWQAWLFAKSSQWLSFLLMTE